LDGLTDHQWRCLVRQVLHWTATQPKKAQQFMDIVYGKSPERWQRLKQDCRRQWDLGSRGEWGKWL